MRLAGFHKTLLFGCEVGHQRPEGVEILLAPGLADQVGHVVHIFGVADLAAQFDGRLGDITLPILDGLLGLSQQLHLGRVVVDGLTQTRDELVESLVAARVGRQEAFLAGQQIAAHAGLHIDRGGEDVIGHRDHTVGVGDPTLVLFHSVEGFGDIRFRCVSSLAMLRHQSLFDMFKGGELRTDAVDEHLAAFL